MSDGFNTARLRRGDMTATEKLWQVSWSLVFWVCCIFAFGFAMLYSAGGGHIQPWAGPQLAKFLFGVGIVVVVALIDIRVLLQYSYVFYGAVLILLVVVDLKGIIGMGAQRWIDLGFMTLQPSELMKPALIMALARYFQGVGIEDIGRPINLVIPVIMTLVPVGLIFKEPDLGTALLVLMSAAGVLFMAGVRMWKFALVIAVGLGAIPVVWPFLHDYQQNRVLTFLNPERDPLGDGYHILQSKIALGSGGLFGKGFMDGTQSRLNFLPEKQTDFIFTMLAEEWGLMGGLVLLGLYTLIFIYGFAIAFRSRSHFGRLLALGITVNMFLYVFINTAMVMGLIPVVGVPLPLISYGGTAMLTVMFGFGLMMCVYVHRDTRLGRGGDE